MRYTSCCLHDGQIQPVSRAKARQGSGCLGETCSYEDQEVEQDQVHAREIGGWTGRLAYGPHCMDTIPGRPSHRIRCRHWWNLVGGWAPCRGKTRHALDVAKAICPKSLLPEVRVCPGLDAVQSAVMSTSTLTIFIPGGGRHGRKHHHSACVMRSFIVCSTSITRPLRTWRSACATFTKNGWMQKRSRLTSVLGDLGQTWALMRQPSIERAWRASVRSNHAYSWEQWCGIIVKRGNPSTLFLCRLAPKESGQRALGPGAIRKVEWAPLASKWLKDKKLILHTDAAKSYRCKVRGLLHDNVVHCKKRVKVNGKWRWKRPTFVRLVTHAIPSTKREITVKA